MDNFKAKHKNNKIKSAKNTISACMIVKNEEQYLDNCLKSIKDIASEIIVVDTGSEDRTVEIARRYTEKIYFHPWKDSFSEARNHCLKYATGDWIFQIDADEELIQEDIPVLMEAVKNEKLDAVMVQIVSKFQKGKREAIHSFERLFRNNGLIHYEGRVHNRLVGIQTAKVFPIRLIHYGYDLNKAQSKKKFDRTVSLLKKDLEENPENPMTYHYLSCSFLGQGMWKESLENSLMAIRLAKAENDSNMIYLWSHYNAEMSYYRLKELGLAEKICMSALKEYPHHIDSHFVLSLVYFDKNKWDRLIEHGKEYIRLIRRFEKSPEAFGNLVTNSISESWNVKVLMGMAYFEMGRHERSERIFEEAIAFAPVPFVALRAIGLFFYNKKYTEKAFTYLLRAHKEDPGDTTVKDLIRQINDAGMNRAKKPTITCCMIVKNEETYLEKCLESIQNYVDEIVIVDTGSTDKTVDISSRYTEKVYFHPWEGSFSKARNQSLSYATSDWIFIIDGDEELLEGNGEKLRKTVLEAGSADAFLVNTVSTYSNGKKTARHNSERLFRNNGVIHYEGIVHNLVKGASSVKASNIEVMHYGYDVDEKKAYEKFIRTTELLKKQINENPQDPMPHHYLSASYIARGMNDDAAKESVLAIDLAEQQTNDHPLYIWTHHIAAMAFYSMGDLDRAKEYSLRALEKYPDHLDSFYTLTVVAAERKKWEDVISLGDNYLRLCKFFEDHPEKAGLVVNNTVKEGPSIHLLIGHAHHAFKSYDLMSVHYQAAYDMADEKWKIWWHAGSFHMDKSRDLNLARRYLDAALDESPEEPDIWYMLAKLNKKSELYQEEKQCLEKLVDLGNRDIMILNRLATLRLESDELEGVLKATDLVATLDPANYTALCISGIVYKRQKVFDRAIEMFTKALDINSQGVDPWIHLGEISLRLDRLDEARVFFERVLFFQPDSIKALLSLCEIELKQGRVEKFIGWCDSILKKLHLNRNITLNSLNDLIPIMFDINFELREQPENISQARKVLSLIPSDFDSFFHNNAKTLSDEPNSEKKEFIHQEFQHLLNNRKSPQKSLFV